MSESDPEAREAEQVAEQVSAGTDGIALAPELTEEAADEGGRAAPPSLHAQILGMALPEKIKLALRGNKEARMLLARDGSKTIRRFVLHNPRISEEEIVALARDRQADEELLRQIMRRREWMKLYQVRLALAKNPRTPLPLAMRQLSTLMAKDLERIAKSRDVPQGVVVQARRMVLESRDRR